jgi:hypothetical protein
MGTGYGALGDGTTTNSSTSVAVSGLTAYMRSRDPGATDGPPHLRPYSPKGPRAPWTSCSPIT